MAPTPVAAQLATELGAAASAVPTFAGNVLVSEPEFDHSAVFARGGQVRDAESAARQADLGVVRAREEGRVVAVRFGAGDPDGGDVVAGCCVDHDALGAAGIDDDEPPRDELLAHLDEPPFELSDAVFESTFLRHVSTSMGCWPGRGSFTRRPGHSVVDHDATPSTRVGSSIVIEYPEHAVRAVRRAAAKLIDETAGARSLLDVQELRGRSFVELIAEETGFTVGDVETILEST
jgi:hypothetical protein